MFLIFHLQKQIYIRIPIQINKSPAIFVPLACMFQPKDGVVPAFKLGQTTKGTNKDMQDA